MTAARHPRAVPARRLSGALAAFAVSMAAIAVGAAPTGAADASSPAKTAEAGDAASPAAASRVLFGNGTLQPAEEARTLVGRPVVAVEFDAPAHENAAALLRLVSVRPGFLLSIGEVQACIERLYALGRFAQVGAEVEPSEGAVVLRFVATPIVRLEALQVRGLKHLREGALLQAIGLGISEEIDGRSEARVLVRARSHAAAAGYPLAHVELARRPGTTPASEIWTLTVREGPANRIEQVMLTGALPVDAAVLGYGLHARPGAVVDHEHLESDRKLLADRLLQHGFWRAQVRVLPVQQRARGALVRFRIDAHERLHFHFAGNRLLPDHALSEAWPHEIEGTPRALLPLFRRRIAALYARESYPHARVTARLFSPPQPGKATVGEARRWQQAHARAPRPKTADIFLYVDEGTPVWVRETALTGATAFPPDIWRQQVLGRLVAEVGPDAFFTPLGPAHRASEEGRLHGLPRTPHRVPAEQRWVADVYAEAAADVGTALGELGFLQAELAPPQVRARFVQPKDAGALPLDGSRDYDESALLQPHERGVPKSPTLQDAVASLPVRDHKQTFIERLSVRGGSSFAASQVRALITGATVHPLTAPIAPGSPFSPAGLEDARIALTRALRNLGFLYARIDADVTASITRPYEVRIALSIDEGPKVIVDHVLVRGNQRTWPSIVLSRVKTKAEEPYRLEQAIEDQQQVMALGVFSRVRVKLVDEEHQSDRKDIVVEVEERPRQVVEVMPGLSSTQGPRLALSYTHLNLLGTASSFVAAVKANRQVFFKLYGRYAESMQSRYEAWHGWQQLTRALEREVRAGLRAPPLRALLFDPLFRLDVVDQRINSVRYGLDATTITLGADLRLARRLAGAIEVQGGIASLECPLGDNCEATQGELRRLRGGRPIQQGRYNTIKVGPWVRYEGRNDPISPSRGWLLWGRVTQVFGEAYRQPQDFGFRFIKYEGQATTYLALGKPVLALGARFGFMQIQQSQIPVDERFFLGGRDSLRGFVEGTLIADDACVVDANATLPAHCAEGIVVTPGSPPVSLGGNSFALVKTELRLPVHGGLNLDLFADVGNLWVDLWHVERFRARVGTGIGLRYATPVGAMTLDFGINPARRPGNDEALWQIHFSIGSY